MMKTTRKFKNQALLLFFLLSAFFGQQLFSQEIPAYFKVATLSTNMTDATQSVEQALISKDFEVLGSYSPEKNEDMTVVTFTRKDLQSICLKQTDRGMLAAVLKIGLIKKDQAITVSVLNPMYIFYAYLDKQAIENKTRLESISQDVFAAMQQLGSLKEPFGGAIDRDDLGSYHYMAFMPYFDDPVKLKSFTSFDEGVSVIRKNLSAGKGQTQLVYQLIVPEQNIAVFGVGLSDPEKGEAHFMPIIGEDHLAALPYEIILQGKEVSMLHGKYRIALHWPKLSMGEFMKIMSTPGDIESMMEGLTK